MKGIRSDELFQTIHVNRTKEEIKFSCIGVRFRDKDTKQIVVYIPSLELVGYGDTLKEAEKILDFSANEFCKHLMGKSVKDMQLELKRLGWKKDKVKSKLYSKSFVDIDGNLKGFNAEEDTIEIVNLELA